MHYHLEVVLPPEQDETNICAALEVVLEPFNQDPIDISAEYLEEFNRHEKFWDHWIIGGRWSSEKALAELDENKRKEFNNLLVQKNITVSGIQFGKHTLEPPSQKETVDDLWRSYFPSWPERSCPLFKHSDENRKDGEFAPGDVMRLSNIQDTDNINCERVIVCGLGWDEKLRPRYMISKTTWNGCTHQKVAWTGTLETALDDYNEKSSHKPIDPDSWVITVDYHS